jgi:phosphomannomutase/phosphomannomutase/phosphoglucomutase
MLTTTSILRAYDVRGTYPDQVNAEVIRSLIAATITVLQPTDLAIGCDVRLSSPELHAAAIDAAVTMGVTVHDLGTISTEQLYYAAGTWNIPGVSITASHNPGNWNGMKLIDAGAKPLMKDGPLGKIYELVKEGITPTPKAGGSVIATDATTPYLEMIAGMLPTFTKPLRLVGNAHFGVNGTFVDAIVKDLPISIERLNWQPDGNFPKGAPDPLLPKNQIEIAESIIATKADAGIAWDADADRCFIYDETGRAVPGVITGALISELLLTQEPGQAVVIDPRIIRAIVTAIQKHGGTPVLSQTGHGFMKRSMRDTGAIFGSENSGHFYYRSFFGCDSGLVTFAHVLTILKQCQDQGIALSSLVDAWESLWCNSDEINFHCPDMNATIAAVQATYPDAEVNTLDGVSLGLETWRCNVRGSQNEPVLRLNVEANSKELLAQKTTELVDLLTSLGCTKRED